MTLLRRIAARVGRTVLLMLIAAAGTVLLVRFAPGYFSDDREMDARYAQVARSEIGAEIDRERSVRQIAIREARGWLKGDFGESRQFHTPVADLVAARVRVSGLLLALSTVVPVSCLRRGGFLLGLPFTILLALPVTAMATACILAESGGPVLVLSLLISAREFKFLRATLDRAWRTPHLLQGRVQGLTWGSLVKIHILPTVAPQLWSLLTLSVVTALGAMIPVEVIFNVPGVGQLAWSAVMNRDLPVLVSVSLLMACVVGLAAMLSNHDSTLEAL